MTNFDHIFATAISSVVLAASTLERRKHIHRERSWFMKLKTTKQPQRVLIMHTKEGFTIGGKVKTKLIIDENWRTGELVGHLPAVAATEAGPGSGAPSQS